MIAIEPSRYFKKRREGDRVVAVSKALPFVESLQGEYTHRVRHVTLHTLLGKSHLAVSCWCGLTICISASRKGRLVAEPGEGRPMCGTCEGRVIGAGLAGSREIAGRPVMFRPRGGEGFI